MAAEYSGQSTGYTMAHQQQAVVGKALSSRRKIEYQTVVVNFPLAPIAWDKRRKRV